MAFEAKTGRGLALTISSDDVTYVTVGQIDNISINIDVGAEESTHGGTSSYWTEWIPGAGTVDVTFAVNWDPSVTEHKVTMVDHLFNTRYFKVTHGADATVWKCQGHYTNISPAMEKNTKMTASATVRLTGTPNFNA